MLNLITSVETASHVVAWYAHTNTWIEICRVANGDDATMIARMMQAQLSDPHLFNGEEYRAFSLSEFAFFNRGIVELHTLLAE